MVKVIFAASFVLPLILIVSSSLSDHGFDENDGESGLPAILHSNHFEADGKDWTSPDAMDEPNASGELRRMKRQYGGPPGHQGMRGPQDGPPRMEGGPGGRPPGWGERRGRGRGDQHCHCHCPNSGPQGNQGSDPNPDSNYGSAPDASDTSAGEPPGSDPEDNRRRNGGQQGGRGK